MRREEKEMEGNKEKKVTRICIEGDERRETTAESWVFVGTDHTNKINTTWVYVREEEEGIHKIIYLIAALAVAGQKMTDAILKTGALTGDELQKLVEMVMKTIKQKEGEAKKC